MQCNDLVDLQKPPDPICMIKLAFPPTWESYLSHSNAFFLAARFKHIYLMKERWVDNGYAMPTGLLAQEHVVRVVQFGTRVLHQSRHGSSAQNHPGETLVVNSFTGQGLPSAWAPHTANNMHTTQNCNLKQKRMLCYMNLTDKAFL